MTYKDILALAHAGYSADQIGKLAMLEQMPAPATPAAPVAPAAPAIPTAPAAPAVPTAPAAPAVPTAPAAPAVPAAPAAPAAPFDYEAMMSELLGIKNAIQTVNVQNSQQPEQPMTADQILANIIAPKPIKKEE